MIRKTAHAGSFYPRFGDRVVAAIESWLPQLPEKDPGEEFLGLIVPHAGYIYSGACAARGWSLYAQSEFDSLVILHPSHHGLGFDWSIPPFSEYETPLGNIEQDTELAELLQGHDPDPKGSKRLHEVEHALEVQLPFIKYFFPDAKICPIMIGRPNPEDMTLLARQLRQAMSGRNVGIVVSTDLSHFHNSSRAEKMDAIVVDHVLKLDPAGLWQSTVKHQCESCGIGGLLALLYLVSPLEDVKARVIEYTHSGIVSGDNQNVVGYLSALLYREIK
ncbi:MAG: AmmeMemoRadiSam system protein B [Candidatus Cloacimonadaceae bacterium]|jgi:AmmeMemoRadiSam system protein B|nr:AmmeMemoRadiSam system protein B [Candidatus Cloacimonadota bacterium]MDX9950313.1 AmmeMemoRadiSam system protein B [Candidatus Syntrophosphaera sp.]NLN85875.1 AmmeMemoRadiSam system protein B [Candidatus Cloacimonadota bacterium]